MKKFISVWVLAFFAVGLFSGCQSGPPPVGEEMGVTAEVVFPDQPFEASYDMAAADVMNYFAENDTIETVRAASPYYLGNHSLPIAAFEIYEPVKAKKVNEAIALTDEIFSLTLELNEKFMTYRAATAEFIGVAAAREPKLNNFTSEFSEFFVGALVQENGLIAFIEELGAGKDEDAFIQSQIEYIKTVAVMKLASVMIYENANTVYNAAQLAVLFENSDDPIIKEALANVEKNMENLSELNEVVTKINQKGLELETSIRQIETGEYYMALASLEYAQGAIPAIKKALSEASPLEDLTKEDLETINEIVEFYDVFSDELLESALAMKTPGVFDEKFLAKNGGDFYAVLAQAGPVPIANAGFLDKVKAAYNGVMSKTSSLASSAYNTSASVASFAWNKTKQVYKGAQIGVGVALDTAGALAKAPMDLGWGLYEGNSWEDIHQRQMNNFKGVYSNWKNMKSGADTLNFAVQTLDQVENLAKAGAETVTEFAFDKTEQFADFLSEQITGEKLSDDGYAKRALDWQKEWTVWGMGHAGKLTAGLFTGLGKGVYRLSNIDSTPADLAEGAIDVAFSFLGGSKLIGKASQFFTAGKQMTSMYFKKGLNFVSKWALDKGISNLKPLVTYLSEKGSGRVMNLLTESLETGTKKLINLSNGLGDKRKLILEGIDEYWQKAPGKALQTLWSNLKGGKDAYKEFVKEEFENTWKGYLKALHSGTGKTLVEYIDNIAGNKADDYLKQFVRYLMTEEGEFEPEEIEGAVEERADTSILQGDEQEESRSPVLQSGIQEETRASEELRASEAENSDAGEVRAFDGVYTGLWTATGQTFNVTAYVVNGTFASTVNYDGNVSGYHVTSSTNFSGTVDAEGIITGSLSGTGSASGNGVSTSSSSTGTFNGKITDGVASVSVDISTSSTTMGQTIGSGYSGSFDLYKQ